MAMPKDIWPDDFLCPKCNKCPDSNAILHSRAYSMQALRLPYFMCGDCRVCSYDKQLIKQVITRWRKGSAAERIPYSIIYSGAKKSLEETLKYYMKTAGYRLSRFKRK